MLEPPEAIRKAFDELSDEGGDLYTREIEQFTHRWGGTDVETMTRVLTEGQGEEVAVAILAIGFMNPAYISTVLRPFLTSSQELERWASALSLGALKDPAALPVLETLLVEGLASRDGFLMKPRDFWYDEKRGQAASLLGEWEAQESIPLLRNALSLTWELEQRFLSQDREWSGSMVQAWYWYQDALICALGRLGAFGVLTMLSFPPQRLLFCIVNLALGHLRAWDPDPFLWGEDEMLKSKVREILAHKFGLSQEEQQAAEDNYRGYYWDRLNGNKKESGDDPLAFLDTLVVNENGELDYPPPMQNE